MKKVLLLLTLIALTSCQNKVYDWSLKEIKTVNGFNAPESMIYDKESGLVFVSNIETSNKGFWIDDGKSYITAMTPEGKIVKERWLTSTPENKLNALKGLTILDGYLYFADNTELKRCSLKNPGKVDVYKLSNAQRLNDVANDGQNILVTDTAQGAIYKVSPETGSHTMIKSPKLVNGVTFANGKYYAVSFGEHEVYELDGSGKEEPIAFGLADKFTNLDAIEVLHDGTFLISDVKGNAIFTVSPDRKTVKKLADLDWAADLGVDSETGLLFVPSLVPNKVVIYQLTGN